MHPLLGVIINRQVVDKLINQLLIVGCRKSHHGKQNLYNYERISGFFVLQKDVFDGNCGFDGKQLGFQQSRSKYNLGCWISRPSLASHSILHISYSTSLYVEQLFQWLFQQNKVRSKWQKKIIKGEEEKGSGKILPFDWKSLV